MSTDHAPIPRVANRYGAPKPARQPGTAPGSGRRRWLIWVALALAVVLTGIFSLSVGSPAVSSKDVGFDISSPAKARVDFEVIKDADVTAQCAVQVLNESYAIVGWTVMTAPPVDASEAAGNGRTTRHSVEVRTESIGVSGGVNACWTVDSQRTAE